MKCGKCGREYQTYNGICPFCHTKNEKLTQAQPAIRYTPIVKPKPSDVNISKNIPPPAYRQSPTNIKKNSGDSLKYILMGGIVLIVVLSVAAVAQLFIGGSSLSASTPEVIVTPEETIPPLYTTPITSSTQPKITYSGSKAGTLSPYSGDSDSANPNPVAPDYTAPGHRWTPNVAGEPTTIPESGGSVMIVVPPHEVFTESTTLPQTTITPPKTTTIPITTTTAPPTTAPTPDTPSRTGDAFEIRINEQHTFGGSSSYEFPEGAPKSEPGYRYLRVKFSIKNNWYDFEIDEDKTRGLLFIPLNVRLLGPQSREFRYSKEVSYMVQLDMWGNPTDHYYMPDVFMPQVIPVGEERSGELVFNVDKYNTEDVVYLIVYDSLESV